MIGKLVKKDGNIQREVIKILELEFCEISGKRIWIDFKEKEMMKFLTECGWTPIEWRI